MRLTLDRMALTGLFMSIGRPAKWKSCQVVNLDSIYPARVRRSHLLGKYDGAGTLIEETVCLGDIPIANLRPNGAAVSVG
jgi:hypothetical protein